MSSSREVLVNEEDIRLDGDDTSSEEVAITSPFDTSKIRVETKNTQMDSIIKRIKNSEIDMSPDFQRQGGIWKDVAKSRLIESMLIKIPLPAFYMDATDDDNWLVVDGLQRLTTIKRFIIDKDLALTGLEFLTDYNGKKFDELPRNFQRRIEETDIVLYLIQPGTPPNVKFDIFRRINTGGEPLSAQEIRHALNQGKITKFLQQLAESHIFKKATDGSVSSKRMDDRECVLRFIAFTTVPASTYYSDNFDQFLNNVMSYMNESDDDVYNRIKFLFDRAMHCSIKIFGKDAFRKRYHPNGARYPINKALFEAWSVNFGFLSEKDQDLLIDRADLLRKKFMELMIKDDFFEPAISQGTGSVKKVRYRFEKISEIIKDTLS